MMAEQISKATKIRQTGITTTETLTITPIRETTEKTNIGPEQTFHTICQARKLTHVDWITAKELYERRKDPVGSNSSQSFRDVDCTSGKHIPTRTHIAHLTKPKRGTISIKVINSPNLPKSREYFITEKGIEDALSRG